MAEETTQKRFPTVQKPQQTLYNSNISCTISKSFRTSSSFSKVKLKYGDTTARISYTATTSPSQALLSSASTPINSRLSSKGGHSETLSEL